MASREEMIAAIEAEMANRQPPAAQPTLAPQRKSAQQYIQEGLATPEQINQGANNAASMMTGGLSKAVPALGKGILSAILEGGALGAAQSPDDRLKGFLTGGALQGGMQGIGQALGKAGDIGMQLATGRKKYTPGVGTELANQGLAGTRGMMKGQVEKRLGAVGDDMQRAASAIPEIDSRTLGQELGKKAASPYTGGGIIAPSGRDAEALSTIGEFADDVASRGMETGQQALARRRAAGSSAYSARSDLPKQNLTSQLSKSEQQMYSDALKKAGGEDMVNADRSYAALKKAQKGLSEEAPLTGFGALSRPISTVGGALPTSIVSQGAAKGGKLAEFLAPVARQASVSGEQEPNKSVMPSRDEMILQIEQEIKARQGR